VGPDSGAGRAAVSAGVAPDSGAGHAAVSAGVAVSSGIRANARLSPPGGGGCHP